MSIYESILKEDFDFSIYEGDKILTGLKDDGFTGLGPFELKGFKKLELNAARQIILSFLKPSATRYNMDNSSYELKHRVEDTLFKETNHRIYVSNGALILAMYSVGFKIKRIEGTPNCFFNVSQRKIDRLKKFIEGR